MNVFTSIIELFPTEMQRMIADAVDQFGMTPEEIRLRVGSAVCLRSFRREMQCGDSLTKEQMLTVVGNAAEGSYHSAVRYIQDGYIPLRGGSRMGVCGSGKQGYISCFGDISSACLRFASEARGCADKLYNKLYRDGYCNTIIIAPPGAGKTTVLRELIRKLSYDGMYVGVSDERGEIAGMYHDRLGFDLGPRSDVLTGVTKSKGAMMLLRSMNPDVIAMDEITAYSDMEAITEAVGCGAGLLTTVHGDGVHSLRKPSFKALYDAMVFEKAVLIDCSENKRSYREIDLYDEAAGGGSYYDCRYNIGMLAVGDTAKQNSIAADIRERFEETEGRTCNL